MPIPRTEHDVGTRVREKQIELNDGLAVGKEELATFAAAKAYVDAQYPNLPEAERKPLLQHLLKRMGLELTVDGMGDRIGRTKPLTPGQEKWQQLMELEDEKNETIERAKAAGHEKLSDRITGYYTSQQNGLFEEETDDYGA